MKQLQSLYIKIDNSRLLELKQSEFRKTLNDLSTKYSNIIKKLKKEEK